MLFSSMTFLWIFLPIVIISNLAVFGLLFYLFMKGRSFGGIFGLGGSEENQSNFWSLFGGSEDNGDIQLGEMNEANNQFTTFLDFKVWFRQGISHLAKVVVVDNLKYIIPLSALAIAFFIAKKIYDHKKLLKKIADDIVKELKEICAQHNNNSGNFYGLFESEIVRKYSFLNNIPIEKFIKSYLKTIIGLLKKRGIKMKEDQNSKGVAENYFYFDPERNELFS